MSAAATDAPPSAVKDDAAAFRHPSDVLIDLVATLLTPMFVGAAGGDLRYARHAALETIWSYNVTTQADLLMVVQMIAFSLASLHTLCAAMTGDVTIPLMLKLNGSAERLSRTEGRIRQARQAEQAQRPAQPPSPPRPPTPPPGATPHKAPQSASSADAAAETPADRVRDARQVLAAAYASDAAAHAAPNQAATQVPQAAPADQPLPRTAGMPLPAVDPGSLGQLAALTAGLQSLSSLLSGAGEGLSWDAMMGAQAALAPNGPIVADPEA